VLVHIIGCTFLLKVNLGLIKEKRIKLFSLTKILLLWVTKALYIVLSVLSLFVVIIEAMSYGSISDKGVVLFLFWGLIFAFLFWLLHIWIKNTKYIGYASTLVFALALLWKYALNF